MWNPLPETDSTFVALRRPRWLGAGALLLAAGLFVCGFLLGRASLPRAPQLTPQFRAGRDSPALCDAGSPGQWFGSGKVWGGAPRAR